MNADGITVIEGTGKSASTIPWPPVDKGSATWCAQCKAISSEVDKLAEEYAGKGVSFYQFDVDDNEDIAQELGIRQMPTFSIFKDGDIQEGITGARPKALREAIDKYV
jgi:thioredoxin 1